MKRFQQTQTCVLSFPLSQVSFDKVFLILMLAAFQLLAFSMNANSNENLDDNTTIEELNSENSNFTTAEEFTCNGISFASYKEHDPACGASNGAIRVNVNNPNNYCLVYRLYNYDTGSWHTGYQTSRLFKDLPAGKYRVKMYRDLNCDINNVNATCYTASDYFYLNCESLCTNELTINNTGSDPARILWWVNTGDQYKTTIQPGESWTTTTYDTYMWRAINDNPDWSNLLYDEHYTVSGCSSSTWNISPNYTGTSCTGEINSIILTNGNESVTLQNGGTYQLCDLPSNNYLEAVVSGNHESFHFNVDGYTRNENVIPYNYPAVSNGDYWNPQVGTHNITGTLYSQDGSNGDACDEVSIQINIVDCAPACTGDIENILLTNGTESVTLQNGGTYQLCDLPSNNYLEAVVKGSHESFRFVVDGDTRNENVIPYNYPAVSNGDYWNPSVGTHTINGTLYSQDGADGDLCDEINITINIVACNSPNIDKTCELKDHGISDNHPGASRLLWLNIDGQGVKEYSVVGTSTVVEYDDGSALITGTAQQVDNTNNKWQYSVRLLNKRSWSQWSALGRSYKGNGFIDWEDHTSWSYYELDNNNSTFTGIDGLAGKSLTITHNPSNYEYGFQVGLGANLKDGDFGFSGWFAFTGSYTGHGDYNGDYDCGDAPCSSISENIPGFIYLGEYNGSKYFCSENSKTWSEAINLVQASGGEIAIINDAGENNFLASGIQASVAWIGYTDENSEGNFGWYNGDPSTYTNWVGAEPNNTDPNYTGADYTVISKGSGDWYDRSGQNAYEIIMEINCGETICNYDCNEVCTRTVTPTDQCNADYQYLNHINADVQPGTGHIEINGTSTWEECPLTGTVVYESTGYFNGDFLTFKVSLSNRTTTAPEGSPKEHVCLDPNTADWVYYQDVCGEMISAQHGTFAISRKGPSFQVGYGANVTSSDLGFGACGWFNLSGGDGFYNFGDFNLMLSDETSCDKATIGDLVFNDVNGNGIQEANEFGLPGVTVMLLNANGSMVATTTTDADGKYIFTDVESGDYKVKFPATGFAANLGYILTQPNQGGNDDLDSDPVVMPGTNDAMTGIFTVNAGDDITNIDAGYFIASKITGVTWEDKNANGIQDPNEQNIDGVVVMLLDENGVMVAQTTTSANGVYTFDNLAPGDYKVKFPVDTNIANTDFTLTTPNVGGNDDLDSDAVPMTDNSGNSMTQIVSVANGQTVDNLDAGYYAPASIGDKVFEDKNGNGIQDPNEPGIDGITVMLLDANGTMITSTTTANGGQYDFTGLTPGTYKIKFPIDENLGGNDYTLTTPNVGGDDELDSDAVPMTDNSGNAMSGLVTLESGDDNNSIDAGYYAPATIGNLVFEDVNGNGIQDGGDDGENGLDGITVLLFDNNGNQLDQTTTANGGLYSFTNLAPGTYKVVFPTTSTINGEDFDLTTPNVGGDDNLDSDAVPMQGSNNAMSQIIVVESGDTDNSVDAGYYTPVSIGDKVFEDKNGNGIQDPGDDGIDGITVMLLDENGVMITSTTTTNGGEYEFTDLAPGTYKVKFEESTTAGGNNYELTSPNVGGNDDLDSDAVPMNNGSGNAMSDPVTLGSGNNDNSIDAGYYIPASVGNYVFNDTNQNGIQDGNDTGIDGVTVLLADANGNILDETTTVDGGFYEFSGLAPGTYKVIFPTDYTDGTSSYVLTFDNNGGNDLVDSDAVPMNDNSGNAMSQLFQLRSGDDNETIDAGFIETAKLGNFVFEDVNENGIQDLGDLPIEGATVELTGTDIFGNTFTQTMITDGNGAYGFDNLVPGSYRLSVNSNDPTFIVTSKDANGNTSDTIDSDIDPTTGITDVITLNAGDDNQTIDAGFHFNTILPVKLISFEAQLVNNSQVVLRWATSSEEDNKHFIVERSADGRDFEPIGVVEGNGTTNVVNTYSLDDLDPFYGANYYRLKQVDYDGDSEYSQVETVVIAGNDLPDVIVYPNPVVRNTTLRVVTPFEQDAQIEIVSQNGQIVKTVTIAAGANSKQLDLSGYSAGVYFAYINFNGHRTLVYNIVKVEE